jgi:hypothetical protein
LNEVSDEFDEDEMKLFRNSTLCDQQKLRMFQIDLEEMSNNLDDIICRKLIVLDLLLDSSEDNGLEMSNMRGKLDKLKMLAIVMQQQASEWK